MSQVGRWGLVAFFFFGGVAFVSFEPTREIWIGQIWIAVSILVAVIYLLVGRGGSGSGGGISIGKTLDLGKGRAPQPAEASTQPAARDPGPGPNTTAKQFEHLEQRRQKGGLSDAEYQAERDRILSEI